MSKQGELTREIRAALIEHGPLSTRQLSGLCFSALETRDISRAIYDLRRVNKIEVVQELMPPKCGDTPAKRYRWVGQTVATHVETIPQPPEEEVMPDSVQVQIPGTLTKVDAEREIEGIVERTDEALLAFADMALLDDPTWQILRSLSNYCHGTLDDHRVARALTDKVG